MLCLRWSLHSPWLICWILQICASESLYWKGLHVFTTILVIILVSLNFAQDAIIIQLSAVVLFIWSAVTLWIRWPSLSGCGNCQGKHVLPIQNTPITWKEILLWLDQQQMKGAELTLQGFWLTSLSFLTARAVAIVISQVTVWWLPHSGLQCSWSMLPMLQSWQSKKSGRVDIWSGSCQS